MKNKKWGLKLKEFKDSGKIKILQFVICLVSIKERTLTSNCVSTDSRHWHNKVTTKTIRKSDVFLPLIIINFRKKYIFKRIHSRFNAKENSRNLLLCSITISVSIIRNYSIYQRKNYILLEIWFFLKYFHYP